MARGLTIRELSQLVGMSPRNIRAHQSRGLLPAPLRQGRVAYYETQHVARLSLVRALQLQGFSLASIRQLVDSPTTYAAIAQEARPSSTSWELPRTVPVAAALEGLRAIRSSLPEEMADVGLLVRDEQGSYGIAPVLAGVAGRLVRAGVTSELVVLSQLAVAEAAFHAGRDFAERVRAASPEGAVDSREHLERDELLRLALQLLAASFEVAFASGAGIDHVRRDDNERPGESEYR